jgi:hypothetical protein
MSGPQKKSASTGARRAGARTAAWDTASTGAGSTSARTAICNRQYRQYARCKMQEARGKSQDARGKKEVDVNNKNKKNV